MIGAETEGENEGRIEVAWGRERGARQKEGRGEGNERLNTHLCLSAAVRK